MKNTLACLVLIAAVVSCGGGGDGGSGSGAGTNSGGGGSTAGAGGSGGAGGSAGAGAGPVSCGGLVAPTCDDGFFCHWENGSCGDVDQVGVCTARPDNCDGAQSGPAVCGCDGQIRPSLCAAWYEGIDTTGDVTACLLGPNQQACGPFACSSDQYCMTNGDLHGCPQLPPGCAACDCINLQPGCTCSASPAGAIAVVCSG